MTYEYVTLALYITLIYIHFRISVCALLYFILYKYATRHHDGVHICYAYSPKWRVYLEHAQILFSPLSIHSRPPAYCYHSQRNAFINIIIIASYVRFSIIRFYNVILFEWTNVKSKLICVWRYFHLLFFIV